MWKACWDCVAGSGAFNEVQNGNNSRAQLNGNAQRLPPWGQGKHREVGNMFYLPKRINPGDKFNISGLMRQDRNNLSISLETENDGDVPFKFIADFSTDKMSVQIMNNGYTETVQGDYINQSATDYLGNGNFSFTFDMMDTNDGNIALNFLIDGTPLETVMLKHSLEDITHIRLDGDVRKIHELTFTYA